MTGEKKPSPVQQDARQKWFEDYCRELTANSIVHPPQPGVRFKCPCCHCLTLDERGGYEICPVCFWEDDGQDDQDAKRVRGGPNGALSLEQARFNFASFGACDERSKRHVRPPTPDELGDSRR
jgi:hypothetical protein